MEKFFSFLRSHKIIVFGLADAVFVALALYFSFALRFEGLMPTEYQDRFWIYAAILVILNIFFAWQQKLYAFTWEFVSLQELGRILKAVVSANGVFAFLVLISLGKIPLFPSFPRSVILINFILDLIFLGGLRIGKRAWQEIFLPKKFSAEAETTLIVGAGPEGEQLLRALLRGGQSSYRPIGFVDHRPEKQGGSIHNVQVIGSIDDIPAIVETGRVNQIIIALTEADADIIRKAVTLARTANIKNIKIIPDTHSLLSGKKMTELREIQVEDLLGRNPAKIDTGKINNFIKNKKILITGAAGSIGSELSRQVAGFRPNNLYLLDFNESGLFDLHAQLTMTHPQLNLEPLIANITDREKIFKLVETYRPDVIFHAAAYKHVPLMENFPEEAVKTNVFGTLNVAQAAINHGVSTFVLVSTDKAIRPISVMGKTKRAAEIISQVLNTQNKTKFISVRFGNVIGSRGSVVPLFQEQIKRRAPITITHPEMTRYFMTIPEAALLIMEAGAVGQGGEVFMLDMGKPVKIIDLAHETIRLAGLRPDVDIPIIFTNVRPGEKIYEEIFSEEEKKIGVTQWDKIFITKNQNLKSPELIKKNLKDLETALTDSPTEIIAALDKFLQ